MDPAHINVTVAKRYINLGAAYGLRARYKLTMHRYADAAADASMAIEASSLFPRSHLTSNYFDVSSICTKMRNVNPCYDKIFLILEFIT